MRISIYNIFLLFLFFALTSCSNKQFQYLFSEHVVAADTAAQNPSATVENYRIKPQDAIQIRNLQSVKFIVDETPLTTGVSGGNAIVGQSFIVDDDGTVALPVIGHVALAGLTRAQAAKLVEDLYRKNLLKDPIIDLRITNLKVTFLGEIKAQGNYNLIRDRTTLVELIGEAGGLTDRANETNIKIIRGNQKDPKVTMINLRDIRSINDPRTILQNGDIIYVSQNGRAVRSDKLSNFQSIAQPALLLLNTALIIFTLSR